jgi:hypothetical protein
MTRAIEVRNPPSFVIVSGPEGNLWLNAHRILSMREDRQGTHIEMDSGETFHVAERAAVIAEYVSGLRSPSFTTRLTARQPRSGRGAEAVP